MPKVTNFVFGDADFTTRLTFHDAAAGATIASDNRQRGLSAQIPARPRRAADTQMLTIILGVKKRGGVVASEVQPDRQLGSLPRCRRRNGECFQQAVLRWIGISLPTFLEIHEGN